MGWIAKLFQSGNSVEKAIQDLVQLYKYGDPYYDPRLQHMKDQCETLKKRIVTCTCGQASVFGQVCHGWPGWIFRFECPKCGKEMGIRDPRKAR